MRTAKRVKREFWYSLLHNRWRALFEITVNMLLNDDQTCLPLEVRGKPCSSGTKSLTGWENTTLRVFK